MKDLNEIYDTQSFMYWCNRHGELNNPYAKKPGSYTTEELNDVSIMPPREQELYAMKDDDRPEYVTSWNYRAYTAYSILFDYLYLQTLLPEYTDDYRTDILRKYAETITVPEGCEILFGEDSDIDGHELLLMIPYSLREKKDEIIHTAEETVYKNFEEFVCPEKAISKTLYAVSTLYENADTHECAYRIRQICSTAEEAEREAKTYMEYFKMDMKEELARFNPGATTRYPLYGSLMESSYDQNDETAEHEYYNQISWGCGQDYRRYAVMTDKIEAEG